MTTHRRNAPPRTPAGRPRGARRLIAPGRPQAAPLAACVLLFVLVTRPAPSIAADFPTSEQVLRVLSLRDYNTRVVVLGVTALGAAAGGIGSFVLLRKRALMGDAASHATLPGIAIAYLIMVALGGDGKWLPGLLIGAAVAGLLGMGTVLAIDRLSRLKEDAALGIVLSVFYGAGVALLGVIQKMSSGSQAGLESFIYGKTASMLASDATLTGAAAVVVGVACLGLYKEFRLVCFDRGFAAAQGWPVLALDALMMVLLVAVTVIGLQAVGLILVIAMLVIPPASARFWTERLDAMIAIAVLLGASSGFIGAIASALTPRLPAGAVIVVVAAALFAISLAVGPSRGVAVRIARGWRTGRRVAAQHLLRALYEWLEENGRVAGEGRRPVGQGHGRGVAGGPRPFGGDRGVPYGDILAARSWSRPQLGRILRTAERGGLVRREGRDAWLLTEKGLIDACRVVRNHRLWEMYLISHADIAPSHVDRDADQIEHVLGDALVQRLEAMMRVESPHLTVPPSPHHLRGGAPT